MDYREKQCTFCEAKSATRSGWFILTRYYGFSGLCCDECYNALRRDSWGNIVNPEAYTFFLLKHGVKTADQHV